MIEFIQNEYEFNIIFIDYNYTTIFQNFLLENDKIIKLKMEDIYSKETNKREIKINDNFLILKKIGEYENQTVK